MKPSRILAFLLILSVALSFLAACAGTDRPISSSKQEDPLPPTGSVTSDEPQPEPERAPEVLEKMTLKEKISQLILPSFRYRVLEDGTRAGVQEITPEIRAMIEEFGFAGLIFFAQNTVDNEKTARMIDAMQTANASAGRPQLLTLIDQEGGTVSRLGHGCRMPGNMALGAANDEELTREVARTTGEELMALGLNANASPVMDVNSNPANPIIGLRSFSDDPALASRMGVAFMQGQKEAGVISTLKHFPGHGDTDTDSHTGLPSVDRTLEELKARELAPFQACIDAGAEMIMTAHIEYPQIETETAVSVATGQKIHLPATLSKAVITDLLRGEMGFDGVVMTDAMNMDAVARHFEPLEAARLALCAGVDLLLMPVDLTTAEGMESMKTYISDLCKMAEEGRIPPERIDESVLRVLRLKERHGLLDPYEGREIDVSAVGAPAHHETENRAAKRAVTLLKNQGVLPLAPADKVTVVVPYSSEILSVTSTLSRLNVSGAVRVFCTAVNGEEEILGSVKSSDKTVLVSALYGAAELDPRTSDGAGSALYDRLIAAAHAAGGKVVLLSAQLPYDAVRYPEADAVALCYGAAGMSEDPAVRPIPAAYGADLPAAIECFFTQHEYTGRLPLDLPELTEEYSYSGKTLYPRGSGIAS